MDKVYNMNFTKIYTLLVNKALRKNRTQEEVNIIIEWLLGYNSNDIEAFVQSEITYKDFFEKAPRLNKNRKLIKGSICGIKVEEMNEGLDQNIRYLDKLIDELAKGKSLDKILRK